jgi:putative radical SAM enzyme (TIGR03279 family)
MEILQVAPDSTGERIGLRSGQRIVAINGDLVSDSLDYRFLISEEEVVLDIEGKDGKRTQLVVEKDPDDDLGVELEPLTCRPCHNRCIFCFVDQMPPGLRKSLYFKDDDYRFSFLHGAYITLTDLSEADYQRIRCQRLSPLYVSVHATDPPVREVLFGRSQARQILPQLQRLANDRITVHAQIVLCPGYNDGACLDRTVADLWALRPWVASVAVVPVGLTRYRDGLTDLRLVDPSESRRLIVWASAQRRRMADDVFLQLADEIYVKADCPVPPADSYGDYPQIENGVGMVRWFLDALSGVRNYRSRRERKARCRGVVLVTGILAAGVVERLAAVLHEVLGIEVTVVPIYNRLFGPLVTVAGLLSGRDIVSSLAGRHGGNMVVIPPSCLDVEGKTLDGMTTSGLGRTLGVPVIAAPEDPAKLLDYIQDYIQNGTSNRRHRRQA